MKNFSFYSAIFGIVLTLGGCSPLSVPWTPESSQVTAEATVHRPKTGAYVGGAPLRVTPLQSTPVTTLTAPTDLWDRIRRGFSMPNLRSDADTAIEASYAARPERFENLTERARRYLFHIVETLELRGMPTELALLPFVESAFNPNAVSPAKAAGMWQFIPSTGKNFDLRQNAFMDDRRDVIASTDAALDYLQKLYDMFGDWHLALAAYNCGEGCVQRAQKKNAEKGLSTNYADLDLPNETRQYVPRFQAIKNIILAPEHFDVTLPDIGNQPFFDTVTLEHDIDVTRAAQLAGISLEDFKALNPAHTKPVIFANATEQILLPWENAELFMQNIAQVDPHDLASWTAWVVPSSMTPSEAAQKLNMSTSEFLRINNIRKKNVRIQAGSTVLAPRKDNTPTAVSPQVVERAQLKLASSGKTVLRRVRVRARKGDTIARIAARYDLPAKTVARWNKAGVKTKLKAGKLVTIYLPKKAGGKTVRKASAKKSKKTVQRGKKRVTSKKKNTGKRRTVKKKTVKKKVKK